MSINVFWQSLKAQEKAICKHPVYKIVELINQLLHNTHPNLTIDITSGKEKQYCLMISAQDNINYFEEAINLYHTAPNLEYFEIVAFRQPTSLDKLTITIDNQNFTLKNEDILVSVKTKKRCMALTLSITKKPPEHMLEHAKSLAVMLLNHVLGEYQFATRVNSIIFVDTPVNQNAFTLTEFTQIFDKFWLDTLGHTGSFPDKQNWQWANLEIPFQHDDVTDIAVISRNESANTLVANMNYCYRLELAARVDNKQTMDNVFELEKQINNQLLTTDDIIYCQNIYTDGIRYMSWYVKYPKQTFEQAEKIRQQFNQLDTELLTEFDPTWADYLQWTDNE